MLYNNSCEEAKYLTDVRREKDAFERLIKERGVSATAHMRVKSETDELVAVDAHADIGRPACLGGER